MWLISQSVKRCAAEKGRQILRNVTANSTVQQTMVFSASNSEAMTPRNGAGRKSMKAMAPQVIGSRRLLCGTRVRYQDNVSACMAVSAMV